jgi:O-methyltransferase involved in polyketide biosynthesis
MKQSSELQMVFEIDQFNSNERFTSLTSRTYSRDLPQVLEVRKTTVYNKMLDLPARKSFA